MRRAPSKKKDILPRRLLSSIGAEFAWQELEDLKNPDMVSFIQDGLRMNIWPTTMSVSIQYSEDGVPRQIHRKNVTEGELRSIFGEPTIRLGKEKHVKWQLANEIVPAKRVSSKTKRRRRLRKIQDPPDLKNFHSNYDTHMKVKREREERKTAQLERISKFVKEEEAAGNLRKKSSQGESLIVRKGAPNGEGRQV